MNMSYARDHVVVLFWISKMFWSLWMNQRYNQYRTKIDLISPWALTTNCYQVALLPRGAITESYYAPGVYALRLHYRAFKGEFRLIIGITFAASAVHDFSEHRQCMIWSRDWSNVFPLTSICTRKGTINEDALPLTQKLQVCIDVGICVWYLYLNNYVKQWCVLAAHDIRKSDIWLCLWYLHTG